MKLCCIVNPMYWCYQCCKQFCSRCVGVSAENHSHIESGKWDFYKNRRRLEDV